MCDKSCTLIVDTGADVSLIKENILQPTTNIYTNHKCMINGVTSGQIETIGISHTNILMNGVKIPLNFQVVDKEFPIATDGILGRDFLAHYGTKICLKTWLLTFDYQNKTFEIPIEDKFDSKIIIPPRCQIIKEVDIEGVTEDCVIIGDQMDPGVFYSNTIVSPTSKYVQIVNSKEQPVTVHVTAFKPKLIPLRKFEFKTQPRKVNRKKERLQKLSDEISLEIYPEAKEKLKELCFKYNDIFALQGDTLTANNFYKQKITLQDGNSVYIKNYRTPEAHLEEIDKQVNKMLADKIIQPSISSFNSPILLVPKKSETDEKKWRLVVDFRQLNKRIIPDKFPLPRIDEILDHLGRAKYFTTLDLMSGFHQIELDENSKKATAFSTTTGHYEFNRLPFGLNISPNSFQRMMTIALSGLPPECAFLYIDDIIVVGCSVNHHLANLEKVFEKLRFYNLKLNPSKCNFFKNEVTYLGHHISDKGIQPDKSKFEVIKNYPVPTNSDEVRRFVAFCNYYRRFIQNFANIAYPLNKLLRKNVTFSWTTECQAAFDTLKSTLISPTILQFPDFKKQFILTTDASKTACGAVLAQQHGNIELPIAFASKAFTKGESNKSTIEQELIAIHWAIMHFRPYLYGRKFLVKTDHRPLVYLFSIKNPSSRLTRMRVDLEEFVFDVEYVQGKLNVGADALSRISIDSETLKNIQTLIVQTRASSKKLKEKDREPTQNSNDMPEPDQLNAYEALNLSEVFDLPKLVIELARGDFKVRNVEIRIFNKTKKCQLATSKGKLIPENTNIMDILNEIERMATKMNINALALALNSDIFQLVTPHIFKEKCAQELNSLQIIIYQPKRLVESKNEQLEIIKINHDTPLGGHVGVNRLYKKLNNLYNWPNMRKTITDYVKQCVKCKENKHGVKTNENFTSFPTTFKTFDSIAMDTIGPFNKSNTGNRYALTIQCDLSKYVVIKPIIDKSANSIAKAFVESFILIYGAPSVIRTDQGTEYKNEVFEKISEYLHINQQFSTPYHPQTIGGLERNHRCLNEYIRQFVNESQTDWDEWLPYYAFCYNTTPNTDVRYTPFELIFGKPPNLPQDIRNPSKVDPVYNTDLYYQELKHRLQKATITARQIITKIKDKRIIDQSVKANPINVMIGDKVMLTNENRRKLDKVYKGPYYITKVEHPNITLSDNNGYTTVVHKNRIIKI